MAALYILLMVIIVLAAGCIWAWKEGLLVNFKELKATLTQAQLVKDDLNIILEKSYNLSREIIDGIDEKITSQELFASTSSLPQAKTNTDKSTKKIRLYELADQLGINSKELIGKLQAKGYNYSSPLNTLDADVAAVIMHKFKKGLYDNMLNQVNSVPPKESEPDRFADVEQETGTLKERLKKVHPYLAVKTLADKGYSIKEIAQLLDRGQGEISLILNLLNKKRA